MNICACAMHCPQSSHHEYACCQSQECDCWCHQIVNHQHKAIVKQATTDQRDAAERAYSDHRRICADVGIEPASFGSFIAEWLECERHEARAPVEAALVGSNDDCQSRNYERMYEGKRGWD